MGIAEAGSYYGALGEQAQAWLGLVDLAAGDRLALADLFRTLEPKPGESAAEVLRQVADHEEVAAMLLHLARVALVEALLRVGARDYA